MMVKVRSLESVPFSTYFIVLHICNIWAIPTFVLIESTDSMMQSHVHVGVAIPYAFCANVYKPNVCAIPLYHVG